MSRANHRCFLPSEVAELQQETLFSVSVLPRVYFSPDAGSFRFETFFPLPFSLLFAAAFFVSIDCFSISEVSCSEWTHSRGGKEILSR